MLFSGALYTCPHGPEEHVRLHGFCITSDCEQSDWVQRKELGLSAKAGSGLKCWTISPAPISNFKTGIGFTLDKIQFVG